MSRMAPVTIKETRNLNLPLETVLEALVHFDSKMFGPLSRGEVLQAELKTGGKLGAGVDVALRMPGSDIIEWRRYSLDMIALAIISFCRARRIPLPFAGAKSLAITRDGVSFHIENTVSLGRQPAPQADLSGRPLRYAKGYEPQAIVPLPWHEVSV